MDKDELEQHLKRGEQWGFVKPTDDDNYLGWILLRKRRCTPVSPFDCNAEPERYANWMEQSSDAQERPYHLLVIELRRDVHEAGDYESSEDYRLRQNYYFSSLDEVDYEVQRLGFSLRNALPRSQLNAP